MEQIKKLLEEREAYLVKLKEEKKKSLQNVPEGSLRICSFGGKVQYYQRTDPKDFNGAYIREKDIALAKKLAQKDYDKRVLQSIDKELNAIKKYVTAYPKTRAEEIYESLHKDRQLLVNPIMETDEQYINKWQNITYHGKEFDEDMPEIYTAKEERVRSKSEVIIADILNAEGIPYKYECPLKLKGGRILYPDFTVLNVKLRREMYWEHLGMMDDAEYVEKAIQKISVYEQNGIFQGDRLVLTYETRKSPIDLRVVRRIVGRWLK